MPRAVSTDMPAQLLAPPLVVARAGRPRVGAGFARRRNGPERPARRAGPDVDGPDVAGRRRQAFVDAPADDQQIAVDHARRGQAHRLQLRRPAQAFVQIDPAGAAEGLDRLAGRGVERVEEMVGGGEDARRPAVAPIGDAAVRAAAVQARVERPADGAGGGVERDRLVARRRRVERAADDDRVGLQAAVLARVVGPGDAELLSRWRG